MNRICRTVFRQSQTVLMFGFDLGTGVFEFCCVFWYHNYLLMNGTKKKRFMAVKGPKGALFYMGMRFRSFCVYC